MLRGPHAHRPLRFTRVPLECPSWFEVILPLIVEWETFGFFSSESSIWILLKPIKGGKLFVSNFYALYLHGFRYSAFTLKLHLEVYCFLFPVFPPTNLRENPSSLGCMCGVYGSTKFCLFFLKTFELQRYFLSSFAFCTFPSFFGLTKMSICFETAENIVDSLSNGYSPSSGYESEVRERCRLKLGVNPLLWYVALLIFFFWPFVR